MMKKTQFSKPSSCVIKLLDCAEYISNGKQRGVSGPLEKENVFTVSWSEFLPCCLNKETYWLGKKSFMRWKALLRRLCY